METYGAITIQYLILSASGLIIWFICTVTKHHLRSLDMSAKKIDSTFSFYAGCIDKKKDYMSLDAIGELLLIYVGIAWAVSLFWPLTLIFMIIGRALYLRSKSEKIITLVNLYTLNR